MNLFSEAYRAIKTGGIIIFETPNPENLRVGTCSFHTDPTHIKPIPPELAEFVASQAGL